MAAAASAAAASVPHAPAPGSYMGFGGLAGAAPVSGGFVIPSPQISPGLPGIAIDHLGRPVLAAVGGAESGPAKKRRRGPDGPGGAFGGVMTSQAQVRVACIYLCG